MNSLNSPEEPGLVFFPESHSEILRRPDHHFIKPMTIAIDTKDVCEHSENSFSIRLLKEFLLRSGGNKLLFLKESECENFHSLFPGINFLTTGRKTESRLSLAYRYSVTIPALLKKNHVDVFLSFGIRPASAAIPQFLFADHDYLVHKKNKNVPALKKKLRKATNYQGRLLTTSAFIREEIGRLGVIQTNTICLVNPFSQLYPLPGEQEKNAIKSFLTGGKEFFLCISSFPEENFLIHILKAFSLFKQRQHSSFKLVFLTGRPLSKEEDAKLETYRYRDDVVYMEDNDEKRKANLITAARGCILSPFTNDLSSVMTGILGAGNILICSFDPAEAFNDCLLISMPEDHKRMAGHMALIYKDEKYRQQLIDKGKMAVRAFSVSSSAKMLWCCVSDAVK